MKKTVLLLMILTVVSKFIGFGREITLSYFYGASNISDAYLISLTIPTVIFAFIGNGIKTTYIPVYSRVLEKDGIELANRFTSNIINFLLIICTIIVAAILIFTNAFVNLFASGFEGETLNLAVNFTRITVFSIYTIGIIYILEAYLQIKKKFIIPAIIGLPLNFIIIASIALSARVESKYLAIGQIIGVLSQLVILIPFVLKEGYKFSFLFDKNDKNLREMVYLALPVILGTSVDQINKLVDRTMASGIAVGGISSLVYANRLNLFIQGIFVLSVSTVMYPMIAKMAVSGDIKGFKKSLTETIGSINLLLVPVSIGAVLFAKPIVELLFGRGAFDSQAIAMTSTALFFYSIGMIGFGLREILSKAFYSLQDTKTPMANAAIGMLLNIVLNIILSRYIGIGGLALATSIAAMVTTVLLFISLRRKIGSFGIKNMVISFVKIILASLLMGLIAKLSFNAITNIFSTNLSLIISIGIGALAYFAVIFFMKIEEVDIMVNAIRRKIKKT